MDRFVTRRPRAEPHLVRRGPAVGCGRQATLHSLAGVVVVEELERARALLEDDEAPDERKEAVLKELLEKRPSTALITKVGIGRTVRRLSEAEGGGETVRSLAGRVFRRWRREVERRVELSQTRVEVRSDKETETRRAAAVKLLETALQRTEGLGAGAGARLARQVERELFLACRSLISGQYRRLCRAVVFRLRREGSARACLVAGAPAAARQLVAACRKPLTDNSQ